MKEGILSFSLLNGDSVNFSPPTCCDALSRWLCSNLWDSACGWTISEPSTRFRLILSVSRLPSIQCESVAVIEGEGEGEGAERLQQV